MWRSFADTICTNTYENYAKKHSNSLVPPKNKESKDLTNSNSASSLSKEAEKMIKDFESLQRKVVEQRKNIKITDEKNLRKQQIKVQIITGKKNNEKLLKDLEMQRIRSYSVNKARKQRNFGKADKKTDNEYQSTFFFTSFLHKSPVKNSPRMTAKSSRKNTISLRDYQDKVMKELKMKIPNYYNSLKEEFTKIRKKSEQTFEQYQESKKLKRTNPYNIRSKSRGPRDIEMFSSIF